MSNTTVRCHPLSARTLTFSNKTLTPTATRAAAMTGSGKRIDVLLVNPGSRAAVYQELGDRYSAIEPPSLAGLFATYLR